MSAICLNGGFIKQTVEQQIGGKITFGLASAALGARAVKNPVIAALCVVGGLMLGHAIDQEVSKRCPPCGAILRTTGLLP